MKVRALQLTICFFWVGITLAVGQTGSPTSSRSHLERFTTPQARAERDEAELSEKLKVDPNNAQNLNLRAYARMGLGNYVEAVQDLRRAVALDPKRAEFQANLGYALWKTGRRAEAVSAQREALKLDDRNFTAHYQLGRFLLLGGDQKHLAEAGTHLRRALEIDPRRSEVRFDLLTVYRTLGDQPNAIAQLNLLQDARPADPRVTYAEALLASDRGDLNAAIAGFRETLRLDASLYGAWQDLGLAFIKVKRWSDALETFAELARKQSDSVEVAYFHALTLFNTGRVTDAEREARRALRLDAGAAAAHTLLGIILASRGGANVEAVEALTQAIALDPTSFDAFFYLGRVEYTMKDHAAAVQHLRSALKINPAHAEAHFFLGTTLEAAGESDAALVAYQKLIEIDPQSAMGQVGLGALQVKQGKIIEAIATLTRATSLDAKSFEAHWALGRALMLGERFAEAAQSLETAVALASDRSDAHYQYGLALRRLGRNEEAKREFAIVERLNAEFRNRTVKP